MNIRIFFHSLCLRNSDSQIIKNTKNYRIINTKVAANGNTSFNIRSCSCEESTKNILSIRSLVIISDTGFTSASCQRFTGFIFISHGCCKTDNFFLGYCRMHSCTAATVMPYKVICTHPSFCICLCVVPFHYYIRFVCHLKILL